MAVHGYSPSLGLDSVREAIARSLNNRFGMNYSKEHIFPTSGAAAALAHAVRAVTEPGDEVLTFAPHFSEYYPYINETGAALKVVPATVDTFQINFAAFEEMLNPKVNAIPVSYTHLFLLVNMITKVLMLCGKRDTILFNGRLIVSIGWNQKRRKILLTGWSWVCILGLLFSATIMEPIRQMLLRRSFLMRSNKATSLFTLAS